MTKTIITADLLDTYQGRLDATAVDAALAVDIALAVSGVLAIGAALALGAAVALGAARSHALGIDGMAALADTSAIEF